MQSRARQPPDHAVHGGDEPPALDASSLVDAFCEQLWEPEDAESNATVTEKALHRTSSPPLNGNGSATLVVPVGLGAVELAAFACVVLRRSSEIPRWKTTGTSSAMSCRRSALTAALLDLINGLEMPRRIVDWTRTDVRTFLLFVASTSCDERERRGWSEYADDLRVDGARLLDCVDTGEYPCADGRIKLGYHKQLERRLEQVPRRRA